MFRRYRWSIGGLLLMSALLARADIMPETCSEYLGEESALIDFMGAEGAKLALPHHLSQVTVRYGETLDKASLRFLLNGEDVTALFQDNPDEGVFGDGGTVQLPLNMGANVLRVSGYLQDCPRTDQGRRSGRGSQIDEKGTACAHRQEEAKRRRAIVTSTIPRWILQKLEVIDNLGL